MIQLRPIARVEKSTAQDSKDPLGRRAPFPMIIAPASRWEACEMVEGVAVVVAALSKLDYLDLCPSPSSLFTRRRFHAARMLPVASCKLQVDESSSSRRNR